MIPSLAGANAVLLRHIKFGPFAATRLDRGVVRPYLGTSPALMTQVHRTLDCEPDLAGSGAAGTAPAWVPWARSAALAEMVIAGSKIEYPPASANFDSLAVWSGIDDQKHLMTGALAKVDLALPAGGLPTLKWSGAGLWSAVMVGARSWAWRSAPRRPKPSGPTSCVSSPAAACAASSW